MSVRTERIGRVLVAHIEREEKRNAINEEITLGIDAALNELDDDPELWVGVLTGTTSVFSAGTDLTGGAMPTSARGGEYGVIRRDRAKPLIAAVEGPAVGGGFEIVLACDLVVASTTATFGLPEVKRGLVPTCGGLFRGTRALPLNVAREMMLTGDSIDAARGYAVGLVNTLTEPGRALAGALALADRIGAAGPSVVRASLRAINDVIAADDADDWAATARATETMVHAPDKDEGMRAFFEKRAPRWDEV